MSIFSTCCAREGICLSHHSISPFLDTFLSLLQAILIFLISILNLSLCLFGYCGSVMSHGNYSKLVSLYLSYQLYPVICLPLSCPCVTRCVFICLLQCYFSCLEFPFWIANPYYQFKYFHLFKKVTIHLTDNIFQYHNYITVQ